MPNQPHDGEQQNNRQQPGTGPRYQQGPHYQQGRGPYWQQGTPYRGNGYGQNPYRPNAWRPSQNPASFGNSLRREFTRDGHFNFPWWAILMGFVVWFPLGFIFLVINQVMRQSQNQPNRNRTTWQNQAQARYQAPPRTQQQAQQGASAYDNPAQQQSAAQPVQYSTAEKSKADILFVAGIVLMVIGGLGGVAELFDSFWILTEAHDILWFFEEMWPLAMFFLGGLGLCYGAQRMRTSWMKRRKIANIVGNADHMYVEDIAASLGCSEEECRQHLENCILKGVFGPAAYIDMHSRALIVRGVPPEPRQKPQPQEKPDATDKDSNEDRQPNGNEKYENILRELRRVNDAIPDEEMSDKISRLEAVSAKIFAQIRENPEKLPQMRKFMDYYLPTSLKLLDTYAELEAQGIEGTNIRESKRRIEQSMDTLVVAFENQLDKLFQDDALDVSADIDVMEQMLSADGLTGNSDPFGLGVQPPQAPQPPKL